MNAGRVPVAAVLLALTLALPASGGTVRWSAGDAPAKLEGFEYAESERSGASLIGAEAVADFKPYEGTYLDHEEAIGNRKYTFRLNLELDEASRDRSVALMIGPGDYPRDIYLNGHLLMKNGDHGDRYNATIYYSSRVLLPPSLLEYGGKPNRIAVEAWPAYETSPLGDFSVGDFYDITRSVFARNLFNIHLVQASVVFALLISVFFLFLYFRSADKDIRYLYCALACLSFAVGYLNMSLYHDAADDVLLDKISRTGLVLTALFLCFFAMAFTGIGQDKRWLKATLAVPAVLCMIVSAMQADKRSLAAFFSTVTTNFLLTPLLLITLGILVTGFVRKRDASGAAVLIGFLLAVAASLHDIYYISIRVAPFCYLVAYGYLALLVSIFFVLALEQARVGAELGTQSARLDGRNRVLAEMVMDLTSVSEGLVDSSASLERTLRETLQSITTYGIENKDISDAFRSQAASAEGKIEQIARRLAASAIRVPKALEAQTTAVEAVRGTLAEMKKRIGENLRSAEASSAIAGALALDADSGALAIGQSRAAMAQAAEHSGALQGVLSSIEDIAERTHVLSINAAIESARLGSYGRGFGVVAQEIRKLSDQSRDSLKSSFEKVGDMTDAVSRGAVLSESAANTLVTISEQARRSARSTEDIRSLIATQEIQGEAILERAEELSREAILLRELSAEEKIGNQEWEAQFRSILASLKAISERLEVQDVRTRQLFTSLDTMKDAMKANGDHIARLRGSIGKAQDLDN